LSDSDNKVEVKCEIKNFRFSAHSKEKNSLSGKKAKSRKSFPLFGDKEVIEFGLVPRSQAISR